MSRRGQMVILHFGTLRCALDHSITHMKSTLAATWTLKLPSLAAGWLCMGTLVAQEVGGPIQPLDPAPVVVVESP